MSRQISMRSKSLPAEYYLEVVKGGIPNSGTVGVTTNNAGVGVNWELIGNIDDITKLSDILPTSASVLNISSTNDDDKQASTGAYQVFIDGLDGNFEYVSDLITLDGQTGVTTSNSYIRVTNFLIWASNKTDSKGLPISEGDIHAGFGAVGVGTGVNANPMQIIKQGWRQALTCAVTVPDGFLGVINYVLFTTNVVAGSVEFRLVVKFFGLGLTEGPSFYGEDGMLYWLPIPPVALPPRTDVVFIGKDGAATAGITAETLFTLVKIIP